MTSLKQEKVLYKQGYRFVGKNSAIKVCLWTKNSLRDDGVCYKQKFYGINCCQCVQMTPSLNTCNQRCEWCWRDINFTKPKWVGPVDDPKEIVKKSIKEHKLFLQGFKGHKEVNLQRFKKAMIPKHFAISLSGEPTFYPKLMQLIKELHSNDLTSFIVSNGTNPVMIKKLLKVQPTQLYLTLPAPNKEVFEKACKPLIKDAWKKIISSMKLLKKFNRSVIRLTLVKNLNLIEPEQYAELIEEFQPNFVELKAFMAVGFARKRLGVESMPLHSEILSFTKKVLKSAPSYKLINQDKRSRVVLLSNNKIKPKIDF
ncbi:MAG: 4-demethylwyosine synthase TYW1 [archaeon]